MNVVSRRTIKEFAAAHADAAKELDHWFAISRKAAWQNFLEVKHDFPDADQYKSLLIFDVRHNTYRLIAKVDYRAKLLMVKAFLTHREYDREDWKKWAQ